MTKLTLLSILSFCYTPRFNWVDYLGYGAYFALIIHGDVAWLPATALLLFWALFSSYYEEKYKA